MMKVTLAFLFLACLICLVQGEEGGPYCATGYCGEGQCCSGGFYHRYCRSYSNQGEPCERANKLHDYKVACPCNEGMFCNVLARCQKYE